MTRRSQWRDGCRTGSSCGTCARSSRSPTTSTSAVPPTGATFPSPPFAVPPGVTVTAVTAGGTPALGLSPPPPSDGTVLFLHGGSYVAGSAFGYQHLAGAIATAATATTLIIDYRLAPEHPYPAGLDDALRAYRWLLHAGTEPGTITVVGDSSGAGLAMSLLLALQDQDTPVPAGAALLCPWVDLT